jgi:hypothetical protein
VGGGGSEMSGSGRCQLVCRRHRMQASVYLCDVLEGRVFRTDEHEAQPLERGLRLRQIEPILTALLEIGSVK